VCIARVGKVVGLSDGMATVEFFDGGCLGGVDLGVAGGKVGSYVEVFGNLALSVLSASEVRNRRRIWSEVREAAAEGIQR
jgi:hydrogenase maturation factor